METNPKTDFGLYEQRNPKNSAYYQCVENHFEELQGIWDEYYATSHGFWRGHLAGVIYRYLDCGDYHAGFARIRCDTCGSEYLLPFSCKRRHFCPSCHQKRVIEFGEFLVEVVLEPVPHRQYVFTIRVLSASPHENH